MKKLNKLFAILVAMAMVLSLTVISAFAEGEVTEAVFTKVLYAPTSLGAPAGSVTISSDLKTIDNEDKDSVTKYDNTATVNLANPIGTEEDGASTVYYYNFADIFAGKTPFDNGGTYVFEVTETAFDITNKATGDALNKDGKKYELIVLVKSDGTIADIKVKTADGKESIQRVENTVTSAKANPLQFKNSWDRTESGGTATASQFALTKEVLLDSKDAGDRTTGFDFELSVDLPTTVAEGGNSATYVIKRATSEDDPVTLTADVTKKAIKLAHGDVLYFTSVPAGTVINGVEVDTRAVGANATYTKGGEEAQNYAVSDSMKEFKVTNTHKELDNTGILMSNLPYIVLALVAIGGMVAYVVVRRRNADEA